MHSGQNFKDVIRTSLSAGGGSIRVCGLDLLVTYSPTVYKQLKIMTLCAFSHALIEIQCTFRRLKDFGYPNTKSDPKQSYVDAPVLQQAVEI